MQVTSAARRLSPFRRVLSRGVVSTPGFSTTIHRGATAPVGLLFSPAERVGHRSVIRYYGAGKKLFPWVDTRCIQEVDMAKPRIQTRVEEDVADAVEEFAEENNLTKSTATRRLVLAGLAENDRAPAGVDVQGAGDDDGEELDAIGDRIDLFSLLTGVMFAVVLAAFATSLLVPSLAAFLSMTAAVSVSLGVSALVVTYYYVGQLIGEYARQADTPFLTLRATARVFRSDAATVAKSYTGGPARGD